jgi:hypothetical protein
MKIIKWWLIKHLIIPKLITDDPLTDRQTKIFRLYFDLDERDQSTCWSRRKLVSYLLYRALPIHILISMMGKKPQIKTDVNLLKLKTVIGGMYYKDYFMHHIKSDWVRQKWYKKNKLPIISKIKNEMWVIDGNHRLAQQILRNKIEYNYIEVNDGWFQLYLKYCIGF